MSFEDPFHDYVHKGYKGHIEQGSNTDQAISNLKDHTAKSQAWGSYEFQ
jgi:prephenate dehydratase